ncbi:twin-arginine translocase subunit TatC [Micrococcus endophyticus]|uniref:twin-arginine translocase subunit TatC n=1 Tax=Micrococcus endophyticus TaxID=455343 RepID=UPI0034CF0B9C
MSEVEEVARRTRRRRRRDNPTGEMPLREHLTELRNRVVKAGVAVLLGMVVGFLIYQPVMAELFRPVNELSRDGRISAIAYDTVASPFDLMLKVSLFIGLVVSSPVWLYQIWAFIVPGLKKAEKKYALGFIAAAVPLFLLGMGLGWLVMPQAVQFFVGFTPEGGATLPTASVYISFVTRLYLAFGVAMVLPVLLVGLNMLGVLPGRTIVKHWRITVFLIMLIAAIAAPGADAISMVYMAVPLVLLFGVAIALCLWGDRRRAKRVVRREQDVEAELASGPKPLHEI